MDQNENNAIERSLTDNQTEQNVCLQENVDPNMNSCPQECSTINPTPVSAYTPKSFCLTCLPSSTNITRNQENENLSQQSVLMMCRPDQGQTKTLQVPPPLNLITPKSNVSKSLNAPPTLFVQALTKLDTNSLGFAIMERLKAELESSENRSTVLKKDYTSPPESLTSAPPSYSFVLRQINRRRPRLMGTFCPSPSFIQHTPPPNYAGAFDIYVDNPRPQPRRTYNFGFNPIPVICPQCGYLGVTDVICKVTICTHLCAVILCLFCCWFCVPLPYLLRSCKDVYHYCKNCRGFLGMYCPTSPENTYPAGVAFGPNISR